MTDEVSYEQEAKDLACRLDGLVTDVVVHTLFAAGRNDLLIELLHDIVGKTVCSCAEAAFLAGVRSACAGCTSSNLFVAARDHANQAGSEARADRELELKRAGRELLLEERVLDLIGSSVRRSSHDAFVAGALAAERRAVVA